MYTWLFVALPTYSFFERGKSLWNKAIIPLSLSLPESVLARTRAQTFAYRALLSHMPLSSPYLRALRRCSPTTLNTHVPAKAFRSLSETGLRAEVAWCSHPLEEIRFSNPSCRYRRLLRRRHFAILLSSLLHGDGKDTAITTARAVPSRKHSPESSTKATRIATATSKIVRSGHSTGTANSRRFADVLNVFVFANAVRSTPGALIEGLVPLFR